MSQRERHARDLRSSGVAIKRSLKQGPFASQFDPEDVLKGLVVVNGPYGLLNMGGAMSNPDDERARGRGRLFDRLKRSLESLAADAAGDVTLRRHTIEVPDQADRERAPANLDALLAQRIAEADAGLTKPERGVRPAQSKVSGASGSA
jgi:hypothetical protein